MVVGCPAKPRLVALGAGLSRRGFVKSDEEFRPAVTALKESNYHRSNHRIVYKVADCLRSPLADCYSC
jgi:hypothetical protein